MRYRPEQVVAILDSERARARPRTASRSSARVDEALAYEPTTALVGVATAGRPLPAGVARAAEGLHRAPGLDVENGLHEFISDDAGAGRRSPRATASSCATCASRRAGLNVPTGANLTHGATIVLTVGSDCAIGKMTVVARARRARRARRGVASEFVPTGQTGIAIAGWGISVDAVVADFIAGASEQLVLEGVARGGELLWVEGQGSLLHPAYSGVTLGLIHGSRAARATCSATWPARRSSTTTSASRCRRSPSSSSCTSGSALLARPAPGGRDRAQHAGARRGRLRARRSRPPRPRPACRRTTPCASAPTGSRTPCLKRVPQRG